MGRRVAGAIRSEAAARGWLDAHRALPPDDELAAVLDLPKKQRAQHINLLRGIVAGVGQGTIVHPLVKAVPQLEKLDEKGQLTDRGNSGRWIPFHMDSASIRVHRNRQPFRLLGHPF